MAAETDSKVRVQCFSVHSPTKEDENMETCDSDDFDLEIHCNALESDDIAISTTIPTENGGDVLGDCVSVSEDIDQTEQIGDGRGNVGMEFSVPKNYEVDLRDVIDTGRIVLPSNLSETTPVDKAARAIAVCLREHKQALIKEVVCVIGVPRAMDILKETKVIQDNGGMEPSDRSKPRRSPGGVFLRLLRDFATKEEQKRIFAKEKTHSRDYWRRKNKLKKKAKKKHKKPKVASEENECHPPENLEKRLSTSSDDQVRCTKEELEEAVCRGQEIEEGEILESVEWF